MPLTQSLTGVVLPTGSLGDVVSSTGGTGLNRTVRVPFVNSKTSGDVILTRVVFNDGSDVFDILPRNLTLKAGVEGAVVVEKIIGPGQSIQAYASEADAIVATPDIILMEPST